LYIPITNISAADVQLRPEFLALLPQAGLKPLHLITLDDLNPTENCKSRFAPENTEWILVDHNNLQGVLGSTYSSRVVGTIDHHDEENKVPKDTGNEPRVIEKSGSCTSLVVEYLKDQWDSIPKTQSSGIVKEGDGEEHDLAHWNVEVAKLALASILIDTANLKDQNKTTKHDEDAVSYLESKIGVFDRHSFYSELQSAKQDIGSLCLYDILRKDYKEWDCGGGKKLGIASVVKCLDFLVEKAKSETTDDTNDRNDDLAQSVLQFAESRNLDVMVVMTAFASKNDNFQREIFACARSEAAVADLKRFESNGGSELHLQEWAGDGIVQTASQDIPFRKVWRQLAVQHSRKRVAPLLRKAIEGNKL